MMRPPPRSTQGARTVPADGAQRLPASGRPPLRLRYALNEPLPGGIGPGTQGFGAGARGNLRDSDNAPSLYGYALYNGAANFDAAVP